MKRISIDPGNEYSAYVLCDEYRIIKHGKLKNTALLFALNQELKDGVDCVIIERIQNLGMPSVGASVFETCEWVGRFTQISLQHNVPVFYINRRDEKMVICGSMNAKDKNIRQALIDRFAQTPNGKGTKKNPDYFYGVANDEWSAFAVLVTYLDIKCGKFDIPIVQALEC